MSGYCVDCKNSETCRKVCGIMFGFCNADFEPMEETIQVVEGED